MDCAIWLARVSVGTGFFLSTLITSAFVSTASATTLDNAATPVPEITSFVSASGERTWDEDAPNFLSAFAPFVGADILSFASFAGALELSGTMVLEVAGNADFNSFGVLDANHHFTSLLSGSDTAGDDFSITLGEGQFSFALSGPGGLFSSVAGDNIDNLLHIIGQQVVKDGTVQLNGASYQVFSGDYVLYMEDLAGILPGSDRDYNDMVVVLHGRNLPPPSEVPEPATMLLLSSGLVAAGLKRRRA